MMLRSQLDSIDQVEVLDVVSRLNTNRGDRVHQNDTCFVVTGV